mmetsp:Transcript_17328/g.42353  ORF Transcript_17328/g.42353 Transcript_17328/m.42353 type:complete len:101 (-) Transcript_17328:51-353(-)
MLLCEVYLVEDASDVLGDFATPNMDLFVCSTGYETYYECNTPEVSLLWGSDSSGHPRKIYSSCVLSNPQVQDSYDLPSATPSATPSAKPIAKPSSKPFDF